MAEPSIGIRLVGGNAFAVDGLLRAQNVPIESVRGNSILGYIMHRSRSNLHLDPFVVWADYRGVDRAIIVLFRVGYVILESAWDHSPCLVHNAKGLVTLRERGDDHPEAENVGELTKREMLLLHLAPNRIWTFFAAADTSHDVVLRQLRRKRLLDLS